MVLHVKPLPMRKLAASSHSFNILIVSVVSFLLHIPSLVAQTSYMLFQVSVFAWYAPLAGGIARFSVRWLNVYARQRGDHIY